MLKKVKKLLYPLLLTYKYLRGRTKQYHQGQNKSHLLILTDLLSWQFREHEFNKMYYAFGLNLQNRNEKDYIGRREFLKLKNKVEEQLKISAGSKGYNYDVVTKDKFITNSILASNSISCIENIALISNQMLIFRDSTQMEVSGLRTIGVEFIIKNTILEAGDGILVCKLIKDQVEVNGKIITYESLSSLLGKQKWVVQKLYTSTDEIRKINSTALNTTRVVTILTEHGPEFLCGFQAFATGNAKTDSWSRGSVYVGIDVERSCLRSEGFFNLEAKKNSLISQHPDSKIIFAEYKIPGLKEAVELCKRAHRLLYFNFVIGWDVALTDMGPIIVEANEKPGMNAVQCINEGLRRKIKHYAYNYLSANKVIN